MEKRGRGEEGRGGEVKKDFRATGGAEGAGKCAQGTRIRAASWQTSAISATKGQQAARAAEGGLVRFVSVSPWRHCSFQRSLWPDFQISS